MAIVSNERNIWNYERPRPKGINRIGYLLTNCVDQLCHNPSNVCGASTTSGWHATYFGEAVLTNITYYCSRGEREDLPAYLPDMAADGHMTRHCCPAGQYWDPGDEQCIEADPCYLPEDPESHECHYDFLNESHFENWTLDVFNPDPDCVKQDSRPIEACCPVNIYEVETYDFVDVEYYLYEG